MNELIAWLQDPVNMAWLVGLFLTFAGALRGFGEFFIWIGKKNPEPDKWDSAGKFLLNVAGWIGKFLAYVGMGNKQKELSKTEK